MPPVLLTDDGTDGTAFWGSIEGNPMSLVLRTDDPADGTAFWDHVDCATECAGTIAAAVAAERRRAMSWIRPGIEGTPLAWNFSDPAGLLSAYDWDPTTGIYEVTAIPGVQTVDPNTWAGWEGQLSGPVDGAAFSTITSMWFARLLRNPDSVLGQLPSNVDFRAGIFLLNGPRATATLGVGGAFRARSAGAVNSIRGDSYIFRNGVWGVTLASTNSALSALQVSGAATTTTFGSAIRGVNAGGSLSSTGALGSLTNSGNPLSQAEWGSETWLAVLFGRLVGNNVAPNNADQTFQMQPWFTYTAPDWNLVEIQP